MKCNRKTYSGGPWPKRGSIKWACAKTLEIYNAKHLQYSTGTFTDTSATGLPQIYSPCGCWNTLNKFK